MRASTARKARPTTAKKARPAPVEIATADDLVALAREPGIRPPAVADLRARVGELRDLCNRSCDQFLLALAEPTSGAAVQAAEISSNFFDGLIESTAAPRWAADLGMWVVDAVWACHDARAILSWAPAAPPECAMLLGKGGKGGKCTMPVAKGDSTCWRCAMGRGTIATAEVQP